MSIENKKEVKRTAGSFVIEEKKINVIKEVLIMYLPRNWEETPHKISIKYVYGLSLPDRSFY